MGSGGLLQRCTHSRSAAPAKPIFRPVGKPIIWCNGAALPAPDVRHTSEGYCNTVPQYYSNTVRSVYETVATFLSRYIRISRFPEVIFDYIRLIKVDLVAHDMT